MTYTRENAGPAALAVMNRDLAGKPYVYGGTYPQSGGTDCDGAVQYGYAPVGIVRTRPTYVDYLSTPFDQRNGHRDDPNEVGDLLFGNDGEGAPAGTPGHVMVYVSEGRVFEARMTGTLIGEYPAPTGPLATGGWWTFRCRPSLALPAPPPPLPIHGSPYERLGIHARPQGPLPILLYKRITPEQVPFLHFARSLLNAANVFPRQRPANGDQYGRLTADRVIRWKRKHSLKSDPTVGIATWASWGVVE